VEVQLVSEKGVSLTALKADVLAGHSFAKWLPFALAFLLGFNICNP
jgi:hypothetical protein